jgi:hypothetical protein
MVARSMLSTGAQELVSFSAAGLDLASVGSFNLPRVGPTKAKDAPE